jgi:hypothetical protein
MEVLHRELKIGPWSIQRSSIPKGSFEREKELKGWKNRIRIEQLNK